MTALLSRPARRRGELVARLLAGSWRLSPPPLTLSRAELGEVAPRLLEAGAAGLAWWRLRDSDLGASAPGVRLKQAYRLHRLQAGLHEQHLLDALGLLRSVGVEPLLAKGWAAARLYPEPGLRSYGDIDLWVRPADHAVAAAALRNPLGERCQVDLHGDFRLLDRSWDEVRERSRLVRVGEVDVRMLGPEDHLRFLCLHMLRHGAWRPLWLCDIGAALEALPPEFDWERCLGPHPRHAEWVACALGLAERILGARVECGPIAGKARALPRWLPAAVLEQWGHEGHYMSTPSMAVALRRPARALRGLYVRWPNPIEATVSVGGPFNRLPRLPFQLGECLLRTAAFVRRMPSLVHVSMQTRSA